MPELTQSNIPATTYGGQFDHLPLPGGGTVGSTPTDFLRRIFAKLEIPDAHHLGRENLCGRYAALLKQIGGEAGDRAEIAAVVVIPESWAPNFPFARSPFCSAAWCGRRANRRHKKAPQAGYALGGWSRSLSHSLRLLGWAAGVSGDGVPLSLA
jgi:hypothetical protein